LDNKQQARQNKMATMSMTKLVLNMSIPPMFSMIIMSLYNVVDSIFVAKLSEGALTAVSLVYPVQSLIIAFGAGTAVGINSYMSRQLGQGNVDAAKRTAAQGLVLSVLTGILFAVICVPASRFFVGMFTKDEQIIKLGVQYMQIVSLFAAFKIVQQSACRIMQSTGDMINPMICQLIGAVTNLILDPIMIFGLFGFPRLEVIGAALATIIGQGLGLVYILLKVTSKKFEYQVKLSEGLKFDMITIKNIYAVSLPSIVTQSIGSFMTAGINGILSGFSDTAVAVMGVFSKLQNFVFMPVFGLGQGCLPIMAFNFGAKNKTRLKQAFATYIRISVIITGIGTALFMLAPGLLMTMFSASADMKEMGVVALRILGISLIPAAIGTNIATTFQSMGRGFISMVISVARQIGLLLPLAFILSMVSLTAVWFALPVAEIVVAIIGLPILLKGFAEVYRTWEAEDPDRYAEE